jgi:hypothetical protein
VAVDQDLTPEKAAELAELIGASDEPVFVARPTDLLWMKVRRYPYAQNAVHAYLESVDRETECWLTQRNYLKRAAQIAMELGSKAAEREEVREKIEVLFARDRHQCFTPDLGSWPAVLAEILIVHRLASDWQSSATNVSPSVEDFRSSPGATSLGATTRSPRRATSARNSQRRHRSPTELQVSES